VESPRAGGARGLPAENALYAFAAALSSGDAPRAAACFTRDACLITPDGTSVHGRGEIVGILGQMTARRTEVEVEQLVVREGGDVALATGLLTIRSDGAEGTRIAQSCVPSVALREVEAAWKIAILSPWQSF
jgi:uncharacterized protein (TIGR02246 family)